MNNVFTESSAFVLSVHTFYVLISRVRLLRLEREAAGAYCSRSTGMAPMRERLSLRISFNCSGAFHRMASVLRGAFLLCRADSRVVSLSLAPPKPHFEMPRRASRSGIDKTARADMTANTFRRPFSADTGCCAGHTIARLTVARSATMGIPHRAEGSRSLRECESAR